MTHFIYMQLFKPVKMGRKQKTGMGNLFKSVYGNSKNVQRIVNICSTKKLIKNRQYLFLFLCSYNTFL